MSDKNTEPETPEAIASATIASLTPNQARDGLLETIGREMPLTTEIVKTVKKWGQECGEERCKDPETYLKCPRCYGLHSVRGNFRNLCDQCQKTMLEHFPNHEIVPHIRAALAKWQPTQQPSEES